MHSAGTPTESSLLLVVPEAEHAIRVQRSQYDLAARVGVPAHITLAYPFKPTSELDTTDVDQLRALLAGTPSFTVELATTGWFGADVLFLEPRDADPIVRLTRAIEAAFPEHPIYRGAFEEIHPHLTVAHDCGAEILQSIEESVKPLLPVVHHAAAVELWSGPALSTQQTGWHLVERFQLHGGRR